MLWQKVYMPIDPHAVYQISNNMLHKIILAYSSVTNKSKVFVEINIEHVGKVHFL